MNRTELAKYVWERYREDAALIERYEPEGSKERRLLGLATYVDAWNFQMLGMGKPTISITVEEVHAMGCFE